MRRLLFVGLLLWPVLASGQAITGNGQPVQGVGTPCLALHSDAAVNTQVTVTVPADVNGRYAYICSWDWTVSEDGTGTAQTNVKWTTTNFGNVTVEYSVAAAPNAIVSGNFMYPTPIRASNPGPVVFTSPAAAADNAYSLNVYYKYGN